MTDKLTGPGEFDLAVMNRAKAGENDPKEIVSGLVKREGINWLTTAFAEIVVEVAERRAADLLRNHRRSAERKASANARSSAAEGTKKSTTRNMRAKVRLTAAREDALHEGMLSVADIADESVFIDGEGWKRYGDCTSSNLRTRAASYAKSAGTHTKRSIWLDGVADLMDTEKATTLDDIAYIPVLPNGETPSEMGDEAVQS